MTKAPDIQEVKQRIQEAAAKDDTETLFILTQTQNQVKASLKLLSWPESLEALFKKRNTFLKALKL